MTIDERFEIYTVCKMALYKYPNFPFPYTQLLMLLSKLEVNSLTEKYSYNLQSMHTVSQIMLLSIQLAKYTDKRISNNIQKDINNKYGCRVTFLTNNT